MSALEKSLQYIKSVTSNSNKDICIANASVCVSDAKVFILDLIMNKSDKIKIKESGYLYEDAQKVVNNDTGVSDDHKIRIGYTTHGFSIICSSKLWFILSQEEIQEVVQQVKNKTAQRYSSDFENWLPQLLAGDRTAVMSAFAGAATHGARDNSKELFGVIDNMDRKEGTSYIHIDNVGEKAINISAVPAVTLTAVTAGMNHYLQIEIGMTISALYADGKPVEQKALVK